MVNILFIHGAGDGAYKEDQALVDNLQEALGAGYIVHYPKMPKEDSPEYARWQAQLTRELAELGDGLVLVGHSLGASVLLKYLAEKTLVQAVRGLFLLASPYWGAEDWQIDEYTLSDDFAARLPKTLPVFFYQCRSDTVVPFSHLGLYREVFPQATFRELERRDDYGGHQFGNDLTEVAQDIQTV